MFENDLLTHLTKFSSAPMLFIGSGMSRRYIGMETWYALLEKMHSTLGFSKPLGYYLSNSSNLGRTDLTRLASLMAAEFNEKWWTDTSFQPSRDNYEKFTVTTSSPLKFEISKYIASKQHTIIAGMEEEIELLKKCQVDGIITTNWDMLLESLFPEFKSFVGQEQLIFSDVLSVGEIYKIHGSISNPESLVLTKEDYDIFHERNPYLAAKLLNIFMEHPIIFMGYSLDDPNIQQILKSILKILTRSNIDKLKDRLIFCEWTVEKKTPTLQDGQILIGDTVLPIKLIKLNDYSVILELLGKNKRKIPVKLLRHMKSMVYDFVKDTTKKTNLYVAGNLDELKDLVNGEFVYGIGLKDQLNVKGVKGITTKDLILDAISDDSLPSIEVSKLILATSKSTYLPYFKHLSKAGFLDEKGKLKLTKEIPEFTKDFSNKVNGINQDSFFPAESYVKKRRQINREFTSIEDLCTKEKDKFRQLMFIPLLIPKKIDLEQLLAYLKDNIELFVKYDTHFRKIVCLYDYLKYKYPLTLE